MRQILKTDIRIAKFVGMFINKPVPQILYLHHTDVFKLALFKHAIYNIQDLHERPLIFLCNFYVNNYSTGIHSSVDVVLDVSTTDLGVENVLNMSTIHLDTCTPRKFCPVRVRTSV
jgi:hypothetical protein